MSLEKMLIDVQFWLIALLCCWKNQSTARTVVLRALKGEACYEEVTGDGFAKRA